MTDSVRDAYSTRSSEYVALLGSMAAMHPSDVALIEHWAAQVAGPLLDAGCGPGHWTRFLHDRGADVRGVDLVPEFVDHARNAYPEVPFTLGSVDELDAGDSSFGGALAWYSLIHHEPSAIRKPLAEFARAVEPGGHLLLGFFEGPSIERFDHAVVDAYRWPVEELAARVHSAGFDVIEVHTRTTPGHRPHAALTAARRTD